MGQLPPNDSVPVVRLLHDPAINNCSDMANHNDYVPPGAGLPPVPAKLVSRIEAG